MTSPSQRPPTRATYQDVLDAPPHMVAQVIDGELHTMPRPTPRHAVAGIGLARVTGPFQHGGGGPGGWWILYEPELHLKEDILVPDLAGWRSERMPRMPETPYFNLPPDWVCEILSPSTRNIDLGPKRAIYAREGIPHLWLVDPVAHRLEAFELDADGWVSVGRCEGNDRVSLPPFEAISFPLAVLWGDVGDAPRAHRKHEIHDRAATA